MIQKKFACSTCQVQILIEVLIMIVVKKIEVENLKTCTIPVYKLKIYNVLINKILQIIINVQIE